MIKSLITHSSLAIFASIAVLGFELGTATASEVITMPQTAHRRCVNEKESGACYEIGYLYQNTSKPGDIALGNQYIRYGCKLELKRKCTQSEANAQSVIYLKAKKEWNAAKQKALNDMPSVKTQNETNCEKGNAKACGSAGLYYFYMASPLNPEKGKAMFDEGCRLGDKDSCSSADLIKKGIVRVYEVEM